MTRSGWILRVLWTVSPHFRQVLVVVWAVSMFGIWTIHTLPDDAGAPYVLLLFCQLFAASPGFRPEADAGRYDVILVGGSTRSLLALAHWGLSAIPGLLAWLVVSSAELLWLAPGQPVGMMLPSLAGFLLVSTVPWAVSLPTVRFFGGTVWVLIMAMVASTSQGFAWVRSLDDLSPSSGFSETAQAVARFVAVPFMYLVPQTFEIANTTPVLVATGGVSLAALCGGVLWVVRRDFPGGAS